MSSRTVRSRTWNAVAAGVLGVASVLGAPAQATPALSTAAVDGASTPVWVPADGETVPVPNSGDAADDPALWRNPEDPSASLVIGNNKLGGLEVYGLDGSLQQRITTGTTFWGNVDVRQSVQIGGTTRDVVAAMNGGLRMFAVDPVARQLTPSTEGSGSVNTGGGEGLCLYQSDSTGSLYAVIITIQGRVRQYVITDADLDGLLDASLVREFLVGSEAEGCLADDATGALYISEEDVGLWRYGAEPDAGTTRTLVDAVTPTGHIARDAEGIALITLPDGDGYVVVSAQNVADPRPLLRRVPKEHRRNVGSFRVTDGPQADGCSRTDGITALAADLGPDFPQGVFICQDDRNTTPGGSGNQDFKLVRLERILSLWTPPPPPPPTEPGSFCGGGERQRQKHRAPSPRLPGSSPETRSWPTWRGTPRPPSPTRPRAGPQRRPSATPACGPSLDPHRDICRQHRDGSRSPSRRTPRPTSRWLPTEESTSASPQQGSQWPPAPRTPPPP